MKEPFIYKGLKLDANINGYATYELKTGSFKTAYLGQLNMYLRVLDDFVRKPNENPSIGISKQFWTDKVGC